jgi:LytS/YehU family sensor histidine kinase
MNQEYGFILLLIIAAILIAYLFDRNRKLTYKLNGRLAGSHSLQNLLISGLYLNHPEERSSFLKTITELIQYSFTSQNKLVVNFEEEFQKINLLVELEFEDLQDNEKEKLKISPFILITLIENALLYGELKNGDIIRIAIEKYDSKLYSIRINGFILPESKQISTPTPGHGIDFVKRRLKFLHEQFHTSLPDKSHIFIDPTTHSLCLILPLLKSY